MKNENEKITEAVEQLLDDNGYTFQGLVRALREQGLDPTLQQMQATLAKLFHGWHIRWWSDRKIERCHQEERDPLCTEDTGFQYVITAHESVEDAETYQKGKKCIAKFFHGDTFPILGFANDAETAHHIAVHDWFGESLPGCAVHTVWERVPSKNMKVNGYKIAYHILGRAVMVPSVMPVREPAVAAERPDAEYIAAEIDAIKSALDASISEPMYRRVRDDAGAVVKLSFAVTVDRFNGQVDAKMSGTMKVENKASRGIKDPAQMELPLDDGGEVNAVVLANARWKQKHDAKLADATEKMGIKARGSRTGTPFAELIVCQMNVRADHGDVTPETVRAFLEVDEKEAQRVFLDMLEAANWATGKGDRA